MDIEDGSRVRAGQLDHGFRRLDFEQELVEFDRVADGDPPRHDLGLGEALADIGKIEMVEHCELP
jgi:hypothetical protein